MPKSVELVRLIMERDLEKSACESFASSSSPAGWGVEGREGVSVLVVLDEVDRNSVKGRLGWGRRSGGLDSSEEASMTMQASNRSSNGTTDEASSCGFLERYARFRKLGRELGCID